MNPQVPVAQTGQAWATGEQVTQQAPQCCREEVVWVSQPFPSEPSQLPHPVAQVAMWQAPAAQIGVAWLKAQALPQVPQFCTEVPISVSQPLPGFPSQSPLPAAHAEYPHTPLLHAGMPPELGHTVPHDPQWAGSVLRLASQPLPAAPSQSSYPASQENPHTPPAQWPEAFGGVVHALPQEPQFCAEPDVEVSQPLAGFESQLP